MKNPHAVALGSIRSPKKAATSAANGRRSAEEGKKGGRPKKEQTMTPRRALIGETMQAADGTIGKVTGITVEGVARLVIGNGRYVDVPQDTLRRVTSDG